MSKIDQKLINIFLNVADMLINHTGLVILIICWIYLFKVGTFGCETEFGAGAYSTFCYDFVHYKPSNLCVITNTVVNKISVMLIAIRSAKHE